MKIYALRSDAWITFVAATVAALVLGTILSGCDPCLSLSDGGVASRCYEETR